MQVDGGDACRGELLASFFAWCLVRMNSTRRPVPEASSCTICFFASASRTARMWCVICGGAAAASSTEWRTGLLR